MAFQSKDLSVLAYANGFTLWHYATNDSANQADSSQYFNNASDMLRVGDMILANVNQSGQPGAGVLVVTSSTGGVVDVANLTAFGASNDR